MSTDVNKATVWDQLRQRDLRVFDHLLTVERLTHAAARVGHTVGTGPLHLVNLVWLAVACAWHHTRSFAEVLGLFLKVLHDAPTGDLRPLQPRPLPKGAAKHHPRHGGGAVSEEAFAQARPKLPWAMVDVLLMLLWSDFEKAHPRYARWKGFRLLALDGTTIALDHWPRLGAHFGTQSSGRGRPRPSARLVALGLPQSRLIWRYELTPMADHERAVAARLLDRLGRDDLVLMDKGFFSYGLFWQIQGQSACFATRLKAGIKLQALWSLGTGDRLVRWTPVDHRKQWKHLPASLTLRVIDYQIKGFRPSAVLTNVLNPRLVSADEWVRMATVDEAGRVLEPGLYHRRWEIETTFQELKVVQGLEGSLRSRTPAGIQYEVAGHVLLYVLTRWVMAEAAAQAGLSDPLRLSFRGARGELADLWPSLRLSSAAQARQVLLPRLLERLASHRVPVRPGRQYPRSARQGPKDKGKKRHRKKSRSKKNRPKARRKKTAA